MKEEILYKETIEAMLEAERIARDPNAKRYTNLDELFEDLKNEEWFNYWLLDKFYVIIIKR